MFLWKVKIVIALCHPLLIYLCIAGNLPAPSKDQEPYHVKANQAINCNAKWIVKQYFWIGFFFCKSLSDNNWLIHDPRPVEAYYYLQTSRVFKNSRKLLWFPFPLMASGNPLWLVGVVVEKRAGKSTSWKTSITFC